MKICSVDICDREVKVKGMCDKHYGNLRNYGHAIALRDMTAMQRMGIVGWDITGDGCWEWRGRRSEKGYPLISIERLGLRHARAHRVMYEETTGNILGDRIIRHTCDNPPCINPSHLEPGTNADNTRDMMERGRHHTHGRTRCPNGHDLTAPGAQKIVTQKNRKPSTVCVECDRDRKRRYAERQRSHS